jgi:uncharacterized membrane protein
VQHQSPRSRRGAAHDASRRARAAWWALLIGATAFGLFAWRYALPKPFLLVKEMGNNSLHPLAMTFHAITASIALLIGPWQLSASLREARPRVHRWLGRIYAGGVVVAWLVSLVLTPTTATGIISTSAFFSVLGLLWIGFTALGVLAIRRGDVGAHRRWMLRSFALAWIAVTIHLYVGLAVVLRVTLRLMLPIPPILFEVWYPIGLWFSMLTNLVVVETVLRRSLSPASGFKPRHTAWQLVGAALARR